MSRIQNITSAANPLLRQVRRAISRGERTPDGLQDPGNAGAVARAAEAFGATGVMFLKGTASPYHPKTLRASAGSLFRVPFVAGLDAAVARATLRQHRVAIYAAMPYTGTQKL